jgi:ABC-type branched-subunit amino acid transport system substrate-binding protein
VLARRRALASAGVACIAALGVAGCSQTGSTSSSSLTLTGGTLVVAIGEPTGLAADPAAQDVVDAEQLAFNQLHGEVTDYKVRMITLHARTLSDNARASVIYPSSGSPDVIAYLGETAPGTSDQTVGITNALDLLQVSPTDTALELSQSTPAVSGAPQTYFESYGTYKRTFARIVPSSAVEASDQVAEMKLLGVSSLYVSHDSSDYGRALADAVKKDAKAAGITLSSASSGAGGDFYAATSPRTAATFFNRVAGSDPSAKLFGPSSLGAASFTKALGSSVKNLYVSIPGFLPKDLTSAGKKFVSDFKAAYHHAPNVEAIFGYQTMQAVLYVIKREHRDADDRTAVVKGFLSQKGVAGVVGTYSINSNGNSNIDAFVFARPKNGALVPFQAASTSQG